MEQANKICSMCGQSFDSDKELKNHQRNVHAPEVRQRRSASPSSTMKKPQLE
jgi:hypothetical protein